LTIKNKPSLEEVQNKLVCEAKKQYSLLTAKNGCIKSFSFQSWLEFPATSFVRKASIECRIEISIINDLKKSKKSKKSKPNAYQYDMLTYAFGLFSQPEPGKDRLIKKFHIDFISTPNTKRGPQHPIFHLQSPGELSPWLKEKGIEDSHLAPSLSEPRLFCVPTTLALLTDFLFREFGGDRLSPLTKVTSESYWKSLIKKNEELVLKPYFEACHGFFCDRDLSKKPECTQLFSQDFVYGNS
jgi:hypothetical protein